MGVLCLLAAFHGLTGSACVLAGSQGTLEYDKFLVALEAGHVKQLAGDNLSEELVNMLW
jgi:hypothetical protein